jgi:hypothetical protein
MAGLRDDAKASGTGPGSAGRGGVVSMAVI